MAHASGGCVARVRAPGNRLLCFPNPPGRAKLARTHSRGEDRTMATFAGALTALITPFRNDAVDERALRDLVEDQITHGIEGLVPCGTTGESVNLSDAEYDKVVRIVVDQAKRRVPVIAGAGTASTRHTLE